MSKKKQGFLSSFSSFMMAVLAILAFRWLLFEPYVIPSGSMRPTLLVHDHILVNKFAYGVRVPFMKQWIFKRDNPKRGDIVVFRAVNQSYFMVKRVVGEPGDKIEYLTDGTLIINGKEIVRRDMGPGLEPKNQDPYYHVDELGIGGPFEQFTFYEETNENAKYRTLQLLGFPRDHFQIDVPEDHLFMMGDNRDNSADSRVWGPLPIDHVLGQAMFVWLSCDHTLSLLPFLCNPLELRWDRFFHSVD
ncbi:MAG: signal peptidase I [Bdellovibrionales bacterium]|nr:signal peptidase I [Bdellovibrionales bacterium]